MKRIGIFAVAVIMAFTGVMSFMPGAAAYDGGLPQAENEVLLTLEIISDTHIGAEGTEAVLNTAVDTFNAESAVTDGIIAAGDLTDSGSDDEFARFYGIIGRYEKGKSYI